jgi:hypothetical protein
MNPFQHGKVYVLNDGAETDLDLGHYGGSPTALYPAQQSYQWPGLRVSFEERRGVTR